MKKKGKGAGGIGDKSSSPRVLLAMTLLHGQSHVVPRLILRGYVPSNVIIINAWLRHASKSLTKNKMSLHLKEPSHYRLFTYTFLKSHYVKDIVFKRNSVKKKN